MQTWRNDPDGPENTEATIQTEREIFALQMQAKHDDKLTGGSADLSGGIECELRRWLDLQTITSDNIGSIRRRCFMPWDSAWNALVRDETAMREKSPSTKAQAARRTPVCQWPTRLKEQPEA